MADGISEKPWSDYTEADYSLEQWHRACLIHQHQGAPTSKQQCKLPVRTPTGVLSRAGVHAAAAALAGARGGVNASADEKMKASAALVRLYGKLNEEPPPSLTHDELANVENFLSHFGRKGMKWGEHVYALSSTKSSRTSVGVRGKQPRSRQDKIEAEAAMHEVTAAHKVAMTSAIRNLTEGEAGRILSTEKPSLSRDVKVSDVLHKAVNKNDPDFDHRIGFSQDGHILIVTTPKSMKHDGLIPKGPSVTSTILITYDAQGYLVSVKEGDSEVKHSDEFAFLMHYGRKGMKWGQHVFTSSTGTSATTLKSKSSRSVGEKLRSLVRKKSSTPDKTMSPVEQHALTDAQRASLISAKAKKSGINSLSNAEMQTLVNRMNLERQYAQLTAQPSKLERGREFVNRQLKTGKTINDAIAFANSPAGKLMFSVMSPTKGRHAVGARASNRDLTPRALRKTRV